ncbi:hypothetical protein acdb102_26940 [Acidothermaceae bacterium B102]|nr:hypothetical protein acdb102_26940 [Acidothermaceae bacterium B102]
MGDPVYTFVLPTGTATSGPDSVLTELRIHGVSGPDPTGILETPAVFHVAGDAVTGFARRLGGNSYGGTDVVDKSWPNRRLEAFSWRGVSSGSASRALWLLLMPFAFLNVAAWMHPIAAANPEAAKADRVPRQDPWNDPDVVWLHRLLRAMALCFTLLLVLATLAATVDVPHQAALSCAAGDGKGWRCSLVRHVWLARPLGLAVTAVALLVLVGLGRSTWKRYDNTGHESSADSMGTPLGNPKFWDRKASVSKQQWVHLAASALLVVWVAVQPALSSARLVSVLILVCVVIAGVVVIGGDTFSMARDFAPPAGAAVPLVPEGDGDEICPFSPLTPPPAWTTKAANWAPQAAVGLVAALFVVLAAVVWSNSPHVDSHHGLAQADPFRMRPALTVLAVTLFLLMLSVTLVIWRLRRRSVANPHHSPMLGGWATAMMCPLAFLAAAVLSNASVLAVAKFFGLKPHVLTLGFSELIDLGSLIVVVTVGVALAFMGGFWLVSKKRLDPDLVADRISHEDDRKAYQKACATAHLARSAYRSVPVLALGGLTWLFATAVVLTAGVTPWTPHLTWSLAAMVLAAVPTGLVAVASKVGDRRKVGVIWDVVTFWPRAVHPLAPPCYAERVIPQLVDRVSALEETGPVLVSGHSQGAMISSALFQQLSRDEVGKAALVTYGCQLSFLFARAFPSYCGGFVLAELAERIAVPRSDLPEAAGRRLAWLNLFRYTDLLGSTVYLPPCFADINREVADPRYGRYRPSDPATQPPMTDIRFSLQAQQWPTSGDLITNTAPQGHSNYPASYEYRGAAYFLDGVLGHNTP